MEGYKIDFKKPMHIYFIGIGGISMSGLAEILLHAGFTISGSDAKESPLTAHLESMGRGQKISKRILTVWSIQRPFIQIIQNLSKAKQIIFR